VIFLWYNLYVDEDLIKKLLTAKMIGVDYVWRR
jgi:hypothetical protein